MNVPTADVIKLAHAVVQTGITKLCAEGNASAFLVLGLLNADALHIAVLEGPAPRQEPSLRMAR